MDFPSVCMQPISWLFKVCTTGEKAITAVSINVECPLHCQGVISLGNERGLLHGMRRWTNLHATCWIVPARLVRLLLVIGLVVLRRSLNLSTLQVSFPMEKARQSTSHLQSELTLKLNSLIPKKSHEMKH